MRRNERLLDQSFPQSPEAALTQVVQGKTKQHTKRKVVVERLEPFSIDTLIKYGRLLASILMWKKMNCHNYILSVIWIETTTSSVIL